MNSAAATALLCLVSLAVSAESLKCFSCVGNGCGDPYSGNNDHQTTCTPDIANKAMNTLKAAGDRVASALGNLGINTGSIETPDIKFVCTKVEVKSGENEVVTRSCGIASDKVDVCESIKNENTMCYTCDSDLCNGATSTSMNVGLVAAAATLLAATYFR